MNSRQRAYLGSLANNIDPIFQIGKASLTPEIIEALDAALEKRELIKVSVLKNCIDDPKEIASVIAERTHSNVVKVIGKKMIFYRKAKKNPKITMINAPRRVTGIAGTIQMINTIAKTPRRMNCIGRSCAVLAVLVLLLPFMLFMESRKVVTISGRDLIREMIPPVAMAPAPMYLT